jgi:nitroreductase
MKGHVKKLLRMVTQFFLRSRCIRTLFFYVLYRKWISNSEAIIALRRKEDTLDESYWMGKLRHYAHVVDKGLCRRDFSKGHGTKAIGMATEALSHITSAEGLNDPMVQWAASKLKEYHDFQNGKYHEIDRQYIQTTCDHAQLLNAIMTRRSIRNFIDKPVSDEVIHLITDVIDWSPTSCHRQPARVYASNRPDIIQKCVQCHAGAACFTDIYAPLFLTFCADLRLYDMPMELAMPHVDVALGVQNSVLVAHSLGLSLTLLTCASLEGWRERELRKVFGIPSYFQIVVSAVGGYPDGGIEIPVRKKKELFIVK